MVSLEQQCKPNGCADAALGFEPESVRNAAMPKLKRPVKANEWHREERPGLTLAGEMKVGSRSRSSSCSEMWQHDLLTLLASGWDHNGNSTLNFHLYAHTEMRG